MAFMSVLFLVFDEFFQSTRWAWGVSMSVDAWRALCASKA